MARSQPNSAPGASESTSPASGAAQPGTPFADELEGDEPIENWGVARTAHVDIREDEPSPGRITIFAWSSGSLTSRKFEVSKRAFVRACAEWLEEREKRKAEAKAS